MLHQKQAIIMKKNLFWRAICLAILFVTSGCFVAQPDIQNPVERKMGWFTYLAGDDMAEKCQSTSPTKIRLIQNLGYYDYVGVYNLTFLSKGDGLLVSDRFARLNLLNLSVSDSLKSARGVQKTATISADMVQLMQQEIDSVGLFETDFETMRAWSSQHYRVLMICDRGKMSFYADKFPWNMTEVGQSAAQLFDQIRKLDPIDADFPPAKKITVNAHGTPIHPSIYDESDDHFVVSFTKDGYAWF